MLRSSCQVLRARAAALAVLATLTVSTTLAQTFDPAPAATAVGWTAPSTEGAQLRVVSEEASSVTVELTASWTKGLAEALAHASVPGLTPGTLALSATDGRATLSHTVSLGARVPPAVEVVSEDVEWISLPAGAAQALAGLEGPAGEVVNVSELRRQLVGTLAVKMLRVQDGRLGRVRRVVLRVSRPALRVAFAARGGGNPHVAVGRSVLADGQWYKIPVREEGVYRLTAAFLRDSLGVASADINRVQVYGNGGRILPAVTDAPRPADLKEVATFVQGSDLLFFAEGPSWWDFGPARFGQPARWQHDISPFSDVTYYFIRVDASAPRRLTPEAFPNWNDAQRIATITDRRFHERDLFNQPRDGSGSGLDWMGEEISPSRASGLTVLDAPLPPGVVGPVQYHARVAARTDRSLTITMDAAGQTLASVALSPVGLTASNTRKLLSENFLDATRTGAQSLAIAFRSTGSLALLDWVEALVERAPVASNGAIRFATPGGEAGRFEFALQGFTTAPEVWDVTESGAIRRLGVRQEGNTYVVQVETAGGTEALAQPRELIAFDPASAYVRAPAQGGVAVPNQNLHGLSGTPDYVIAVAPEFAAEAERLAAYRRQRDGLETVVITTDQVNNEFASGTTDMRAIRDYMKFLYDRAPDGEIPRYLLLFGDGHFDFRNIIADVPNFVPTFQTEEMFDRTDSYTSDDYFAILADGDGQWATSQTGTSERVQLGVGRFPVRTMADATALVDKVQLYEGSASRGDWRTRITFVGDDQYPNTWDHDLHVLNANGTAQEAARTDPSLTVQKIYAPSYPLVLQGGNRRRPAVTDAVVRSINEGTLVWNYSGHGSPENLGDERYFTEAVLDRLENTDRPSIFVTATCSFGKFDIETEQSMAERVLLRPEGGGIAMFTTVRIVYTGASPTGFDNFGLNVTLSGDMFARDENGRPRPLGDILFETKNTDVGASLNNRKFNLLGDPAMRIGLPERQVSVEAPSALRAYEEATVTGRVLRPDGSVDGAFSGEVDVRVFDALRVVRMPATPPPFTLPVNIPNGEYNIQTDAIYAGRATVRGGEFSATFRVPQDVSYSGEPAKVLAYAVGDGALDASGTTGNAVVSTEAGVRPDDGMGPNVRLFLGDTTFVSGGLTRPDPILIARLADASGINTVGAGVGHELLLTIDGDASTSTDVGRYYQGDLDTYRSGTVRFPLPQLAPGAHTATLTAWDAVNNSTTAEVAFTVSDATGLEIRNLFPYPNPTAGPTNFTFEHNLPGGTPARIQLRIFTIAGRPIRTFGGDAPLFGGVLPPSPVQIAWDGRDDDLDRLATGVYLFRLRIEVDAADGGSPQVIERVERLAIIR